MLMSAGDTHAIITVRELPPSESWRRRARVTLACGRAQCWTAAGSPAQLAIEMDAELTRRDRDRAVACQVRAQT